jgi:hypothetical protein
MKNVMLAIFVVPFLVMPAFAGSSNAGDKPMVVADHVEVGVGGVGVGVGDRHRHRDEGHPHHRHHYDDRR